MQRRDIHGIPDCPGLWPCLLETRAIIAAMPFARSLTSALILDIDGNALLQNKLRVLTAGTSGNRVAPQLPFRRLLLHAYSTAWSQYKVPILPSRLLAASAICRLANTQSLEGVFWASSHKSQTPHVVSC